MLLGLGLCVSAAAQQRHKIAVFTPLYLDSVTNASGGLKFDKNNFPKYVLPGLEFYQGVQAALDSLEKRSAPIEVFIYDSRGRQSVAQQLAKPEMTGVEMILAQSNVEETRLLAAAALQKKVPFISATLPNDAGITNNPYFVLLNSSLQTHVEGIYQFLQKYHGIENIIVFRKSGAQENTLRQYLANFAQNTTGTKLNLNYVDIGTNFNAQTLAAHLDSSKKNICIAGSLNIPFAQKLTSELDKIAGTYAVQLFGMPTWENLNLGKLKQLEVVYTTAFYYSGNTWLENSLTQSYITDMNNRPSDMFFRGYETMLRFALLLLDTKQDVASNLTRKGNTVFTEFEIEPVFKNKNTMTLDYFENKHLYFVQVMGGAKNILQ